MPLSSDKIPNNPLSGTEVMNYSLALVREYCERYRAYPVKLKIEFTMRNPTLPRHAVTAGRIPNETPDTPQVALESLISEAASAMRCDYVFGPRLVYPNIAYEISISFLNLTGSVARRVLAGRVDNPNLVRVHYRLPIIQVEKIMPTEDTPFGGIRNVTMDIDSAQYPKPKAPDETDLTPHVALLESETKTEILAEVRLEDFMEPEVETPFDDDPSVEESNQPRTRKKRA